MSSFKSFAFADYAQQTLLLLFIYGQLVTNLSWIMCNCVSAEVDVVISSGPWVDSGTDTTLTCTSSSPGTIREVTLSMSSFNETTNDATEIVLYISPDSINWGNLVNPNHYEFDETLSGFPLTIKSVSLDDEAKYWCMLNILGVGKETGSDTMRVRVPPNAVAVSYLDTLYSIDSSPVSVVAGSDHQFTCKANGIKPEAIFTWTYNNNILQGTPQESTTNANDDRLFDSSDVVTINIPEIPAEQPLKCGATNRQDESTDAEVEINLMLQVKVPPKGSLMSLYDSSMELIRPDTPLAVDEGTPYTITCKVQGTRPAASIQWMVDGAPHQASDTTQSEVNGLIDTQGMLTFTPTRDNHRKNVTCTASTADSQSPYPFVTTTLDVTVFPSSIILSDSTGPITGGTSYLVEGDNPKYTCVVPDINPGASFTWTVGDQELDHSDRNAADGPDGFTNSTSDASLIASFIHHGQDLKCLATNKAGADGKNVSVIIDVKVPPKDSSVSLSYSGNDLNPGVNLTVNQGEEQTLTCTVRGSRPAATIDLYRNGSLEETEDQIPAGDGLVDTMENLVFTPQRDYHKQLVECVAKTSESTMPYPAASLTLDVDGPPDTPVTSGSVTMTENVATTLTCTADLGFPEDWVLVWSNEGTAIENPPGTTAVLSGTSQRYMFTSQLEFTPKRQDNTHIIKCSASRPSWTSTPLPEQIRGSINVHYETNITNKHLTEVGIKSGLTANLSCTAKGNPAPVITWFDPNKTEIIHGGNDNKYMVEVSYTTSDTDMTIGNLTTSKLSIRAVDGQVDYGVYTCNSINGIGLQDLHEIILNGTRRPNKPTNVVRTDRTSSSIAVRWTAGYDGGEPQWFHVSYKKTADSSETVSDKIDGGVSAYNVDGLESYTEYKIMVYTKNELGRNPSPGSIVEYTLPVAPTSDFDFTLSYNSNEGTVIIDGLQANGGCIQLEVKYKGIANWISCGDCITTDGKVALLFWCLQTGKRRRRATGDVEVVRARLCQMNGQMNGQLCSDSIDVMERVTDSPASSATRVIFGVTFGVVSLAVIFFLLGMFFGRKFQNRNGRQEINLTLQRKQSKEDKRVEFDGTSVYNEVTEMAFVESPNPDQSANTTYANVLSKDKAFPRGLLKIVKELGQGAFGQVFLAKANGIIERSEVTLVAVKTLKEGASAVDKKDMMRELDLMKKLPDHCNIIKLLGFSVEQDPPYIIVEYLSRGDLKELMKDSRSKGGRVYGNLHGVSKSLTSGNLVKFANDVADGMHFISSHKCIHRDLATRNVLVAEDMTCKVSDFGLARDLIDNRAYERRSQGRLPLRWMAMESVVDDVYTTESDVWSFGVLLWEIVTLGSRPYPSMSAKTMIEELQAGYRMPKPNHCQEELYRMMLKCWKEDPNSRPNFKEIGDELRQLGRQCKELISIRAYNERTYEVTVPNGDQERV